MSNKTAQHNSILTSFQKKNYIRHCTHTCSWRESTSHRFSGLTLLLHYHPGDAFSPVPGHQLVHIPLLVLSRLCSPKIYNPCDPPSLPSTISDFIHFSSCSLSVAVWYLHLPHSEFPCSYPGLVSRLTFCFILYQFYWAFPDLLGDNLNLLSSVRTACQVHWIRILLFM